MKKNNLKVCIVGSSDSLKGLNLGHKIDSYDIVVRINFPQIEGYKKDVGAKTNHLYIATAFLPHNHFFPNLKRTNIINDTLDSLATTQGSRKILLKRNGNFDLPQFRKDVAHLLREGVEIDFGDFNYPRKSICGFSNWPLSGTTVIHEYLKTTSTVDICGFGDVNNVYSEYRHYWSKGPQIPESHDPQDDFNYIKKLKKQKKLNILDEK